MIKEGVHFQSTSLAIIMMLFSGVLIASFACSTEKNIHLFILSGQSNMKRLDPDESFAPSLRKAFRGDEIIVVKDARIGQPISRWYKRRKSAQGQEEKITGDLYDRLMTKVKKAVNGRTPSTITFIWMQGESDALNKQGQVYAASLKGLIDQLREDLKFKDINFVIGRISHSYNDNKIYPCWTMVRQAQVEVAESDPRGAWVDTDDLNGPNNDWHYTKDGYRILGERFAAKAINLIKANSVMATKPSKTDARDGT